MNLEHLLRQNEGKTLEFKRDLSSPAPALRSLVAFANAAGGRLVIGVEDRTRTVVGVEAPLDLEERLANLIADSIEPRLLPEIEIVPWRKTQVVVVTVHPSNSTPHYLKSDGPSKGTYVRLGSTNREADAVLIAELARRTATQTFDERAIPELSSEAIDFAAASQSFADRRPLRRQDLEALGLLSRHQGRAVPTVGGLLLFGKKRLSRFPDAWIQAGRFAGTDRTRLVDRAELTDYPVIALAQAVSFVERNTALGMSIGRLQRRDAPAVPPAALREALVNAVVHADYALRSAPIRIAIFDDRVEVENPGILLPGLTIEDLREGVSRARNRVLARVFKELGLIEQWGTGVQRMVAACTGAGLPEPEFREVGLRFRVILGTEPIGPAAADATEKRILEYIAAGKGRSTAAIAEHVGLSRRATQLRLSVLQQRGLVAVVGSGPRDPRRKWYSVGKAALP